MAVYFKGNDEGKGKQDSGDRYIRKMVVCDVFGVALDYSGMLTSFHSITLVFKFDVPGALARLFSRHLP